MEPTSAIVSFIKYKFMKDTITVSLLNGTELIGKVVEAFDSLVGLDTGNGVIYINAN
jgi:small nuclear ribonucleoprotein (snRNP)-like protein